MSIDVTIVGGGIVGQVAAQLIAQHNLQVALINQKKYECKYPFDPRVFAISHKSSRIFRALGLNINNLNFGPIYNMHVWDSLSDHEINFSAQNINLPNIGYVIEQSELIDALSISAKRSRNLHYIEPAVATDLTYDNELWQIKLNNNKTIKTKLLIGADGAHSIVRQAAKIHSKCKTLQHVSLVTTLNTDFHNYTAQQVFVDEGPVAVLPLYDKEAVSLVYSGIPYNIEKLKNCNHTAFVSHLNKLYNNKLHFKRIVTPRITFPLYNRIANTFISKQIALIGDAIRSVHPLAGQGLNLGINDAFSLYSSITSALLQKKSFYHEATLQQFERQAKYESQFMQNTIYLTYKSFTRSKSTLRKLANIGFSATNKISQLNKKSIQYALNLEF